MSVRPKLTEFLYVSWIWPLHFLYCTPRWVYVPGFDNCQPYLSLCALSVNTIIVYSQHTMLNFVDNYLYIVYIVVVIVLYCIVRSNCIANCISFLILLFNSLAFNIISCTDMVWYINCSLWSMFCLVLFCLQCCTSVELNGVWIRNI